MADNSQLCSIEVIAWNNGDFNPNGAGYGIRIKPEDRDQCFQRDWHSVIIELEGNGEVEANISDSFWRDCSEPRSQRIGQWIIGQDFARWENGNPPQFLLTQIDSRRFRLSRE